MARADDEERAVATSGFRLATGMAMPQAPVPDAMRPMFTVHVGEYLVGDHIERAFPRWNVWVPSKDTGTDLLVTEAGRRKAVSLQVKFSKDFNPNHRSPLLQGRLLAAGWWTLDPRKIQSSSADYWVFVLPCLVEKQTSFIILPPAELLRRLRAIHGTSTPRFHLYLRVTKTRHCWDTRGLSVADQELVALDRYSCADRDFTSYLGAWGQIGRALK